MQGTDCIDCIGNPRSVSSFLNSPTMSNYTEYQKFLAKPESARLAGDVSLIYVPTTTKFDKLGSVISHLSKQAQILKTKRQEITGAIEGADAICLDVETTIEFTNGGGAYLPSLDHVLVDHPVTFPTVNSPRSRSSIDTNACRFTSSISTPNAKSNKFASTGTRPLYLEKLK